MLTNKAKGYLLKELCKLLHCLLLVGVLPSYCHLLHRSLEELGHLQLHL